MENLESLKSAKFEKSEQFKIKNLNAVRGGDECSTGPIILNGVVLSHGDCVNEDGSIEICWV
jgi:hypothetical protein